MRVEIWRRKKPCGQPDCTRYCGLYQPRLGWSWGTSLRWLWGEWRSDSRREFDRTRIKVRFR